MDLSGISFKPDAARAAKPAAEAAVHSPYDYMERGPSGKNMRGRLIEVFNKIYKAPEEAVEVVKEVVHILHTSSLIVDDVEDESLLRRGIPCAHRIYGVGQSVNCANLMYFEAMALLRKLPRSCREDAYSVFIDEMERLHRGQGLEMYWRDSGVVPTETEYVDMAMNKTGGLFRLAARLLGGASTESDDCDEMLELCNVLGVLYQVRDDYLNFAPASDSKQLGKGFCEDITEAKYSFPIAYALQQEVNTSGVRTKQAEELARILKLRTNDTQIKEHALAAVRDLGGLQYAQKTVQRLAAVAKGKALLVASKYDVDLSSFVRMVENLAKI